MNQSSISVLATVSSKELENLLSHRTTALLRNGFPNRAHEVQYPADIYLALSGSKGAVFAHGQMTFAMIATGDEMQLHKVGIPLKEFRQKLHSTFLPVIWTLENIEPANLHISEFFAITTFKRLSRAPSTWTYAIRVPQ